MIYRAATKILHPRRIRGTAPARHRVSEATHPFACIAKFLGKLTGVHHGGLGVLHISDYVAASKGIATEEVHFSVLADEIRLGILFAQLADR